MQYTIFVNQRAVIELGLKVDIVDMAIFHFIQGFSNYGKCQRVKMDEEEYFCISTDLIERELPMLGLKRRAIYERVNKLIEAGLLERCNDNKSAHRTYLRFGEKYGEYMGYASQCTTMHENAQQAMHETAQEQIIYNNNIYNNKEEASPKTLPVHKFFISSTERAAVLNNPDKIAELKRTKFFERCRDAAHEAEMSREQFDSFCNYWCEHDPGSEKVRCEEEKFFDPKKRMRTWLSRSYNRTAPASAPATQPYKVPRPLTREEIEHLYDS